MLGRRSLLTAVTMLALTGVLVLGATWGWKSLFADFEGPGLTVGEPGPTCTTERVKAGAKLRARQVEVSVFNAGTRSGLAGQTLDALVGRGFVAGEVGNGPSGLRVLRVQVWSTEKDDPAARLVARQFGPGVKVKLSDKDLGGGVDVLIGDDFKSLSPAPRKVRVHKAQEYCVPAPETPEPID